MKVQFKYLQITATDAFIRLQDYAMEALEHIHKEIINVLT